MDRTKLHQAMGTSIRAAVFAISALAAETGAQPAANETVMGSAPTIMSGLAPAWADAFARRGGDVRIAAPFGPPQGALDLNFGAFLDGRLAFAFLTREIAEADLARYRAGHDGREPCIVPVAGGNWKRFGYVDAVAFIVNRQNPLRRLSFRQIDSIYASPPLHGGPNARTWGELGLGGSWRHRPIRIKGGDAWSKEESARALTVRRQVLSREGRTGLWTLAPGTGDDQDVVARVAADPEAIGFTGLGHVEGAVRVVAINRDGEPAILPTADTARSGRYPLLRTIDMLVDPHATASAFPFAHFLLSRRGQSVIAQQGDFMKLPPGTLQKALRRLDCLKQRRRSGSSTPERLQE